MPYLGTGRIFSRITSGSTTDRFISVDSKWNSNLLAVAFLPFEVDAIMNVPIHPSLPSDDRY